MNGRVPTLERSAWARGSQGVALEIAHNLAMNKTALSLAGVVALVSALAAQAPAVDVMPGRWTLDPAKSTYVPGPVPKSQVATLTAVANGIRTVADRVEADGSKTHF